MRNSLDQLLRLHGWKLDEARRKAIELDRLAEHLRAEIAALDADLARERAAAEQSPERRRAFPAYTDLARARRARLEKSLEDVEAGMERAREDVTEAVKELQRYELALRNRSSVRQAALRRPDPSLGDEPALSPNRRRS